MTKLTKSIATYPVIHLHYTTMRKGYFRKLENGAEFDTHAPLTHVHAVMAIYFSLSEIRIIKHYHRSLSSSRVFELESPIFSITAPPIFICAPNFGLVENWEFFDSLRLFAGNIDGSADEIRESAFGS